MSDTPIDTVRTFAATLDHEDFQAAKAFLAKECVYLSQRKNLAGPKDIIKAYQAKGKGAHRRFDAIECRNEVESSGAGAVIITFSKRVRLGTSWHVYCCRQHVQVGHTGLIEAIRHEEIDGERERLRTFEMTESTHSGALAR